MYVHKEYTGQNEAYRNIVLNFEELNFRMVGHSRTYKVYLRKYFKSGQL